MVDEKVPFEVTDAFEVGDLSQDQSAEVIIPPTSNVLLEISKAKVRQNEEGSLRNLSLQAKIVEGIDESGKYAGKVLFVDIPVWADMGVKTSDWYKTGKFRADFKALKLALGYDIKETITFNDEFLSGLNGRQFRGNIGTEKVRVFNESTGNWENTEDLRNRVRGIRKA